MHIVQPDAHGRDLVVEPKEKALVKDHVRDVLRSLEDQLELGRDRVVDDEAAPEIATLAQKAGQSIDLAVVDVFAPRAIGDARGTAPLDLRREVGRRGVARHAAASAAGAAAPAPPAAWAASSGSASVGRRRLRHAERGASAVAEASGTARSSAA